MAASSLVVMVCLLQIDRIVEGDLYSYGLQFSSVWAGAYSSWIRLAFVLGWFNIVAATGVHLYSVTFKRKELEHLVAAAQEELVRREAEAQKKHEEPPPILPGISEQEFRSRLEPQEAEESKPEQEEVMVPACS